MSAPTWWLRLGEWFAGLPWWGKILCGLPVLGLIVLGYVIRRPGPAEDSSTGAAVEGAAGTIAGAIEEADDAVAAANAEIKGRAEARAAEVRAAGGDSDALRDALLGFWHRRRAGRAGGGRIDDSGG